MTKLEYMDILREKLARFGEELQEEILEDYRGHFAEGERQGKTQEQIIQELGSIDEMIQELGEPEDRKAGAGELYQGVSGREIPAQAGRITADGVSGEDRMEGRGRAQETLCGAGCQEIKTGQEVICVQESIQAAGAGPEASSGEENVQAAGAGPEASRGVEGCREANGMQDTSSGAGRDQEDEIIIRQPETGSGTGRYQGIRIQSEAGSVFLEVSEDDRIHTAFRKADYGRYQCGRQAEGDTLCITVTMAEGVPGREKLLWLRWKVFLDKWFLWKQ